MDIWVICVMILSSYLLPVLLVRALTSEGKVKILLTNIPDLIKFQIIKTQSSIAFLI